MWADVLELQLLAAPFAAFFVDQVRARDILDWKASIKIGHGKGEYSPHTANSWLRILSVIIDAYVARFELERNPMLAVPLFDTTRWRGKISKEQPNSLTPDEFPVFLRLFREMEPEHFAMASLGFAFGARPSSLRPIRRAGEPKDYDAETGSLVLRRSHTRGNVAMESTKTAMDLTLVLPTDLREIIAWHVEMFCTPRRVEGGYRMAKTSERRAASPLLFPSRLGSFQCTTALWKPFASVSAKMREVVPGFAKIITPKGMRRTNKDLMRAAGVSDMVAMAVANHATADMHKLYSTVSTVEMTSALARVVDLAGYRQAMGIN